MHVDVSWEGERWREASFQARSRQAQDNINFMCYLRMKSCVRVIGEMFGEHKTMPKRVELSEAG